MMTTVTTSAYYICVKVIQIHQSCSFGHKLYPFNGQISPLTLDVLQSVSVFYFELFSAEIKLFKKGVALMLTTDQHWCPSPPFIRLD